MRAFIYLWFSVILCGFSFNAFSIEINDDLFIEESDSDDEGIEIIETAEMSGEEAREPNIKKEYKKETVIIKRDISSLQNAIQGLDSEDRKKKVALKKDQNKSNQHTFSSKKKSSLQSVDYGDYEIHWSKTKRY